MRSIKIFMALVTVCLIVACSGKQQAEATTGCANGHEWVDLGLPSGLKWATCNVGASSPEGYGNYYAWGETSTKSEYTKTYGKHLGDISGNARYDAARANWGGSWRMPTRAEFEELINHCTWQWTTQNGVVGYKVTSKTNSNSIFLPAVGYKYGSSQHLAGEDGLYWSSTPYEDDADSAYYLRSFSDVHYTYWRSRDNGLTVRPVCDGNGESEMTTTTTTATLQQAEPPTVSGTINGKDYVDLGLPSGLKWATCNVGASCSEQYGNYYAWGETSTKSEYSEENCQTWGKNLGDISGNPRYDAARANWGGSWRMPGKAEFDELRNHCTWLWTTQNGVNGYKVTSKTNSNSIFLPAAGYKYGSSQVLAGEDGYYLSSTPYEDGANSAYDLLFDSGFHGTYWSYRYDGRTVRPVCDGNGESEMTATTTTATLQQAEPPTVSGTINGKDYVDLGLPSGLKWATCNIGASSPEQYGNYYAWGETTTKSEYTEENCQTYGMNFGDISGNAQYDAARANWGGSWRMPRKAEFWELIDHCDWQWTTQNGVKGYKVTSKTNGNSIFLPAADWYGSSQDFAGVSGDYWSSTPDEDDTDDAYYLYFDCFTNLTAWSGRYDGGTVRPVCDGNGESEMTTTTTTATLQQAETPTVSGTTRGNITETVNGVTFKMVYVQGGIFSMGAQNTNSSGTNYDSDADSDESPVHSVTLGDYYIAETEVTQALWQAVMGNNPSYFKGENRPVETVSWDDAVSFCKELSRLTGRTYVLPTEAQWEYAARGGKNSTGSKYSGSHSISNVAWYAGNSDSKTHEVKGKMPNALGIYDMSGNVWEWCSDYYTDNYNASPNTSVRVLRGGSWSHNALYCRVSHRNYFSPSHRRRNNGFRVALSVNR